MSRWPVMLLLLSLSGCATTAGNDWTRFSDGSLNEWVDGQALPQLTRTFAEHPRFKSEAIRIAVLDAGQVAASSNGLATGVRDALYDALLQQRGLNIILADGPAHCRLAPVAGYYLAIEASSSGSRGANVHLRVYDIVEQQWVSGFSYQWRGDLSAAQRDALGRTVVAESARGLRILPFTADQSDLLAERLASDLACQLKREGNDELLVQPDADRAASLIAGNLAGKHMIPVASTGALKLETRVHKVDDQLYQVWAILTPGSPSDELSAIATSAYATRPLLQAQTTAPVRQASSQSTPRPVVESNVALLSSVRIIGATRIDHCDESLWRHSVSDLGDRPVIAPYGCYGLQFERRSGTRIYVFSHAVDGGLKRLYPADCARKAVASENSVVRFPARHRPLQWDSRSGTETIYVIAARGRRASGRLDRLVNGLPDICGDDDAYRAASPQWLDSIDRVMSDLDDDVAWEAVRVYHQPRTGLAGSGQIRGARK